MSVIKYGTYALAISDSNFDQNVRSRNKYLEAQELLDQSQGLILLICGYLYATIIASKDENGLLHFLVKLLDNFALRLPVFERSLALCAKHLHKHAAVVRVFKHLL